MAMATEYPVEVYESHLKQHEFLFFVAYRGHWCPFCMSWLKSLLSLKPNIEARGGAVLLMTSESPDWTQTVRDTTAYKDTIIIDPENKLAAELKKRGLIDLAISSKSGYPHGMSQPGILVVRKDESVLYSWAINPSLAIIDLEDLQMNLGGAKDRPVLSEVLNNVKAKLDGEAAVHEKIRTFGAGSLLKKKLFG